MEKREINEFDPVTFSIEENEWLLANIDKPSVVAMRGVRGVSVNQGRKNGIIYPDGVKPGNIKPLLDRLDDLDQLQAHEGQRWVGREAIKKAIKTYLEQDRKWQADWKRTGGRAPRFPSMYSFDSKGRAHLGGPGSDSGRVRTYFNEKGERVKFAIQLVEYDTNWVGPVQTEVNEPGLTVNAEASRIECFCGHTEHFKEGSRSSYNAARARISKHLRKATDEVERHRELHTNEFGG